MSVSNILVGASIAAVAVVLFMGLANMLRGGSPNTSQLLMRWRIALQFIAIVVILAVLFFRGHGP